MDDLNPKLFHYGKVKQNNVSFICLIKNIREVSYILHFLDLQIFLIDELEDLEFFAEDVSSDNLLTIIFNLFVQNLFKVFYSIPITVVIYAVVDKIINPSDISNKIA